MCRRRRPRTVGSVPASDSTPLSSVHVGDLMRHGLIRCPPDASLITAARFMADRGVHSVLVTDAASGRPWGIVSDVDVARAVAQGTVESTAAEAAGTPLLTVESSTTMAEAARLMAEHQLGHLVVVSRHERLPIGVISTLDVARALTR